MSTQLLRLLAGWEGKPFAGVALVAPVLAPLGIDVVDGFVKALPKLERLVPLRTRSLWTLLSDDDPYLQPHLGSLIDRLVTTAGGHAMVLQGRGHFFESAGCREIPELERLLLAEDRSEAQSPSCFRPVSPNAGMPAAQESSRPCRSGTI